MDVELVKRVLLTNIYVDEKNQPRSASLLLRYEPQIDSFLEGPTVPRSQEVRVEPTVLFIATPATTELPSIAPNLIPTGQVYEMAPLINPFKLMGKKSSGSPYDARKGKGKGTTKGARQGKKNKKPVLQNISPEQAPHSADSGSAAFELPK